MRKPSVNFLLKCQIVLEDQEWNELIGHSQNVLFAHITAAWRINGYIEHTCARCWKKRAMETDLLDLIKFEEEEIFPMNDLIFSVKALDK